LAYWYLCYVKKAGVPANKAIIPIYNTWEVVKLCGIPKILVLDTVNSSTWTICEFMDQYHFCDAF
jgi:hypothetical protein